MKRLTPRLAPMLLTLALCACGSDPVCTPRQGTQAHFDAEMAELDTEARSWLAFPYPSDHRRTAAGTIRMGDFPDPFLDSLLEKYVVLAEETLDGFATNGGVHVLFDGPLDVATLPTDPAASSSPSAPLQLVDITPSSPEYGRRRPLRWEYASESGDYLAANSLAVAPTWGFPLREQTTYALIVTSDVKDAEGRPLVQPPLLTKLLTNQRGSACLDAPVDEGTLATLQTSFAPLRTLLRAEGMPLEKVAVATVFTTQSITAELAAVYDDIQAAPAAPALDPAGWQPLGPSDEPYRTESFQWSSTQTVDYWVLEGRYAAPNYQVGAVPYNRDGRLNFDGATPSPYRTESLRFVLTVPKSAPGGGRSCYPVVQYAHGTGGSAYGFANDVGGRLAAVGLAAVGIDQPMHGLRTEGKSFLVDLQSFNYLNPEAARANFRQSAIDTFALTRFVRESLEVPADKSPTGSAICFDPQRVGFFGHSHGGLSGAMASAFEKNIDAWVLSGAGGGLSITVMEREIDLGSGPTLIKDLIELALGLSNESLSELHPIMTLVQTMVEVTDPVNYSPYWVSDNRYAEPRSFFVTSGHHDTATPYRTANAMAVAAGIPVVEPLALPIPQYDLAGIPSATAPLSQNFGAATAGFLQWTNDVAGANYDTHFLIFYRPEAIHGATRFLESAAYEAHPQILRNPAADAR